MGSVRLAILGAGSVRCSVPVIASLATFFGERPLEVALYDADEERLDLFDRFARLCFMATRAEHSVFSTTDPTEALDGVNKVIVQVGENCARKLLGSPKSAPDPTDAALDRLMLLVPDDAEVACLLFGRILPHIHDYIEIDWPPEPTPEERQSLPHQVLRYLNGEEYLHEVLTANSGSPLRPWLDLPVLL